MEYVMEAKKREKKEKGFDRHRRFGCRGCGRDGLSSHRHGDNRTSR